MPVIKELYDEFNSKGLDVVGVAVWDEPEDSKKAMEQLELPWPQILNAKSVLFKKMSITNLIKRLPPFVFTITVVLAVLYLTLMPRRCVFVTLYSMCVYTRYSGYAR